MACLMRLSILVVAVTRSCVRAQSHWVQDLDLYEDPPGSNRVGFQAGEKWSGCVLKTCKSPEKFQTRCPPSDNSLPFPGPELAQDAVFASGLHDKAAAVAAYMRAHSQEFKQDVKAIWANNGKGLLMGFPGNRPEIINPESDKAYKVWKAKFQQENAACSAGKRLGEIRLAVTVQEFIKADGTPDADDPTNHNHDKDTVPLLRIKVENHCLDCGSTIDKGFYLRIEHTETPETDGSTPEKQKDVCPVYSANDPKLMVGDVDTNNNNKRVVWDHKFEFTGRKALPCGSTGSFDVLLTALKFDENGSPPMASYHWPCEVKITLVSPCREELAFLHLVPPKDDETIVAPSWLGAFWR